jgi:hypothetical protein
MVREEGDALPFCALSILLCCFIYTFVPDCLEGRIQTRFFITLHAFVSLLDSRT